MKSTDQKLDFLIDKVTSLEVGLEKLTHMQERLDSHEKRIQWLEERLHHVQKMAEYSEGQDKRMNLIFAGVPEVQGRETWDDVQDTIKGIIKDKMNVEGDMFIQRAHRMAGRGPQPRKIVCKFGSWSDREKVLRNRKNLSGSDIFISEHYTERVQHMRNCLHRTFKGAVDENGRKPRLMFDKIWLGQSLYTWDFTKNDVVELRSFRRGPSRSGNFSSQNNFLSTQNHHNNSSSQPSVSNSQHPILSSSDQTTSQSIMSQPSVSQSQNLSQQQQQQSGLSQHKKNPYQLMPIPTYHSTLMAPPPPPPIHPINNKDDGKNKYTFKRRAEKTPPGATSSQVQEKRGRQLARGGRRKTTRSYSLPRRRLGDGGDGEINVVECDKDEDIEMTSNASQLSDIHNE